MLRTPSPIWFVMLTSPADLSAIALAKAEGQWSEAKSGGEGDLSAVASVAKEEGVRVRRHRRR